MRHSHRFCLSLSLCLVAAAGAVGCASIHVPPRLTTVQCVVDPAVTGSWTDRRMTQLGPAWVKVTLGCDCTKRDRAQLLWMRITGTSQYRAEAGMLQVETQRGPVIAWPYRIDGDVLSITEAPGEVQTYTRSGANPCPGG
jgi:hypothetical protein